VIIESSLITKAVWSALVVLGLSAIAERVSPRVAGIIGGAPHGTVLVYFFVGRDLGADYVVDSAPYGIAAFTATIAFMFAYQQVSLRVQKFAMAASTVAGTFTFLIVALGLAQLELTLLSAVALTVTASAASLWLMRRIADVRVARPVRLTLRLLAIRAGLAAFLVVLAIAIASSMGPRWAGLMVGYPMTMLPTLLIVHATYGAPSTRALISSFPLGVGSIVIYILMVSVTFPSLGVAGGTLTSLLAAMCYLAVVMSIGGKPRRAVNVPSATTATRESDNP
jgi:hypothetical protein